MTRLKVYGDSPPGLATGDLPGRLIVLEGTDRVGRSTQVALLTEWLEDRGYAVVSTGLRRSELVGAGIARARRGHTLDPITLNLLYATDLWDRLERQIIPALRAGMVALVDRYAFSLIGRAMVRGVSRDWIEDVCDFALVPDRVIYLDIDLEHLSPRALSTAGFEYWEAGEDVLRLGTRYQNWVEYQTRLLEVFRELTSQYSFTVIDARRSIAEVFEDVAREVSSVVADMGASTADTRNEVTG